MMIKKITDMIGAKVYTDVGDFFGEIVEANLMENKIDSWKIKVGGSITSLIGGAKGVVIPHRFIKAMSDIVIINKSALPTAPEPGESVVEELE